MQAYTYVDWVYFNKSVDATNQHHNKFIFNQESDFI